MTDRPQRLVVGISGASGARLGIRLLEALRPTPVETHLVLTSSSHTTIEQESEYSVSAVRGLADVVYRNDNIGASIASGSFQTLGMVVVPCSIKTLSAVANSYTANLLTRSADVCLKEGRPLVLVVREAPLHLGHLRLMVQAAECGAIIFPPVPAFYTQPQNMEQIINQIVGRVLARIGIQNDLFTPWNGK